MLTVSLGVCSRTKGTTERIRGDDPTIWANPFTREMVALLGRPCAIEAREVDIQAFNLDTSPVDLQYLERMVNA